MNTRLDVAVRGLLTTPGGGLGSSGRGGEKRGIDLSQSVGDAETIRPRPGLLLPFPSGLLQQVRSDRGDGLQMSIAYGLSL